MQSLRAKHAAADSLRDELAHSSEAVHKDLLLTQRDMQNRLDEFEERERFLIGQVPLFPHLPLSNNRNVHYSHNDPSNPITPYNLEQDPNVTLITIKKPLQCAPSHRRSPSASNGRS